MSKRETWVFPSDGSPAYMRGTNIEGQLGQSLPAFVPDMPDFVSPIDGKRYSGRAGMREHNKRHDVVSNLELKGLPTLTSTSDTRHPQDVKRDKAARLEQVARLVNQHYR